MYMNKLFIFILACGWSSIVLGQDVIQPIAVAKNVSDLLLRESKLSFVKTPYNQPQEDVYYVDFSQLPEKAKTTQYIATTEVSGAALGDDGWLALSHAAGKMEVYWNGKLIATTHSNESASYRRLEYGLNIFAHQILVDYIKQKNKLTLVLTPDGTEKDFFYTFLLKNKLTNRSCHSSITYKGLKIPFVLQHGSSTEVENWHFPRPFIASQLPEKLNYSDWQYYTGTFLAAMYDVSNHFPELDYQNYINAHIDFFLTNRFRIAQERKEGKLRTGPFNLYFRFHMLDDFGPQGVPLLHRMSKLKDRETSRIQATEEYQLLQAITKEITQGIPRLPDGTLTRVTPDSFTVQADDLFMSCLYLIKAADILDQPALMEDAVLQIKNYHRYLYNPETQLYKHAWFSRTQTQGCCHWGRGMGWMMMVYVEALNYLAADHPERATILKQFQQTCDGLVKHQGNDGRWHQIIDNPQTYLESSATAMFTRVLAEGVVNGWLEGDSYRTAAMQGWAGLCSQIAPDGQVSGIVRGTPIFNSERRYNNHSAHMNDPRGLGAILWAAIAINMLQSQ